MAQDEREKLVNILVTAALAAALAHGPAVAPVHDGPYTYTPAVHVTAGRWTYDLVTFRGTMCRGGVRYAVLSAGTDAGGEESEPGTVHGDHISFRLVFGPGDRGTWYFGGVSVACLDGSEAEYWGRHPSITVY